VRDVSRGRGGLCDLRYRVTILMWFVYVMSCWGCATTRLWHGAGRAPRDAVLLDVEGLRQSGSNCGPNALAMLLAAAGDRVPVSDVTAAVQNQRLNGALSIDLVLFARSRGHAVRFCAGDLPRLREDLDQGRPALLLLDLSASLPLGLGPKHMWHYVVAYGSSASKGRIFVHSGVGEKYLRDKELLRLWEPGGYWMMTIDPRGDLTPGEAAKEGHDQ
jgi:ABC-type bacteriocin/lantibiotic exporter with double-glycine peptidase domain